MVTIETIVAFVAVVVLGCAVGVLSALLGIGGATLMIPAFRLIMGLPALQCTATSLFCVILTSLTGATMRIKNHLCVVPMGLAIGLAGACTSPVGAWLAQQSPSWMVMTLAAVCIAYAAVNMFRNSRSDGAGGIETAEYAVTARRVAGGVALGLVTGLASGYVGLGGGFIIVPMLMQVGHMTFRAASGTSLVAIVLLAVPGVVMQALAGNVVYWVGIAITIGAVPGAIVGARVLKRTDDRKLCLFFGILLLVSAAALVGREFGWM